MNQQEHIGRWNVETLHEHIRSVIDERDQRYEQRFISQKASAEASLSASNRAVDKAEEISEKWRNNANEWRAAMSDRDRVYVTKETVDARFSAIDLRFIEVLKRLDRSESRGVGLNAAWVYLVGAIVAICAILSVIGSWKIH